MKAKNILLAVSILTFAVSCEKKAAVTPTDEKSSVKEVGDVCQTREKSGKRARKQSAQDRFYPGRALQKFKRHRQEDVAGQKLAFFDELLKTDRCFE